MRADLTVWSDPAHIERAADPAQYVVSACEQAKEWLALALERGDIDQIVELKSQAEAIRIYTAQKQLGKDAELSAQEIVRRAERGLGVAIRKAQEAGEIRDRGQRDSFGNQHRRGVPADKRNSTPSPHDFASAAELTGNGAGIYRMTDGVSDDQFESALDEAKSEGNLSRANVVRKVQTTKDTGRTSAGGEPIPAPVAEMERTPEPSRGPKRRPLPDAFREAAYKAMKTAESIRRLTEDDRWNKNAPKIDPISRDNLQRAADLLSKALDSLIEGQA